MKCSVCAQEVPEAQYGDHLAAEHGVTDDPSAVLFEHLTGDHDETQSEDDEFGDDFDGEDEEERVTFSLEDDDFDEADELEEEPFDEIPPEDEPEPPPEEEVVTGEPAAATVPDASDQTEELEAAAEGVQLDEVEQAEEAGEPDPFAALTDAYPGWDVRGGAPDVGTVVLPSREKKRRWSRHREAAETEDDRQAQEAARAREDAHVAATAEARDMAEARLTALAREAEEASDAEAPPKAVQSVAVAEPQEDGPPSRRRDTRRWALVGLICAVALIAAALVGILTRDSGGTKTSTTTPGRGTTVTTVAPTFLPGPQGGATTTLGTLAPAVPAVPATRPTTTAAPNADPAAQMAFSYIDASCTGGGLTVRGNVANNNPAAYSFTFTVDIVSPAGTVLGTADGSVEHLAAHNSVGFEARGTCTDVTGGRPQQRITSITPG